MKGTTRIKGYRRKYKIKNECIRDKVKVAHIDGKSLRRFNLLRILIEAPISLINQMKIRSVLSSKRQWKTRKKFE